MVDDIPESVLDRFRLLAARDTLRSVATEEIVALANQTLTEGVFNCHLLAMVDASPQTRANTSPHLKRFCEENQIPIGNEVWAIRYMLKSFVPRIVIEGADPSTELCNLASSLGTEAFHELQHRKAEFGVDRLFFSWHIRSYLTQIEAVDGKELEAIRQSCASYDIAMREAANEWLKVHVTGTLDGRTP